VLLVGQQEGHPACKRWGDGGGGHWLVRLEWCPAGLSVYLPLLIFPCTVKSWGPIHKHCPKIYLKTCHKIILWEKLRCHKMILRHILCQFTKLVLEDLKYSQDMTRCHSNDVWLFRLRLCIMILAPVPIFYPFVSVPVPPFDQSHDTSTIRPLMWRRLVALSALYNDDQKQAATFFYILVCCEPVMISDVRVYVIPAAVCL